MSTPQAVVPSEVVTPIDEAKRGGAWQDRRLGALLVQEGRLDAHDVDRVLERQRRDGLRFGEAALRLRLIDEEDLRHTLARQFQLPDLLPGSASEELVAAHAPFHPRAEELRALRNQLSIRWTQAGTRNRLLAIMSPGRREGRSYLAANLALVFAQFGERTLLIDADLRQPRLHQVFNVPDQVGLSAVLSGRADAGAAIPVSTRGKLTLLPAGAPPPNPQELLSSPALGALLEQVWPHYDVILLDTPPAKHYADAHSVAFVAGSALMLARKEHTRLEDLRGVTRELSDSGVRVVGSVLNAF
jgi:protein-tyrosine kinase